MSNTTFTVRISTINAGLKLSLYPEQVEEVVDAVLAHIKSMAKANGFRISCVDFNQPPSCAWLWIGADNTVEVESDDVHFFLLSLHSDLPNVIRETIDNMRKQWASPSDAIKVMKGFCL